MFFSDILKENRKNNSMAPKKAEKKAVGLKKTKTMMDTAAVSDRGIFT